MAVDGNKAFAVDDNGLILGDSGVGIFSGPDDPTVSPPSNVPSGSLYLRTTGQQYRLGGSWAEEVPGGISTPQHRALDQLVHDIAETSYLEVTRTQGRVSSIIVWTDSGKTVKIREVLITRSNGTVSQIVTKQYNGSGTLVETLTDTVTRSGGKVASIAEVLT